MTPVSIIIAVYNRATFIDSCIKSILNQNYHNFELIIVDDGSTDGTKKILQNFKNDSRIKLVFNKTNFGLMYSRNKGIKESCGEYIAFTDSDCIVDKDWISELIKPFVNDKNIMIVGGQIVDPPPTNYWECVNKGCNFIASKSGYVERIVGCSMAYRRIFFKDNLFDEALKYGGEELEKCLICKKRSLKVYYIHTAKVVHYHRSNFKSTFIQYYKYGYGNTYFYLKQNCIPLRKPKTYFTIILMAFILMIYQPYFTLNYGLGLLILFFLFYYFKKYPHKSLYENIISFPGEIIKEIAHISGKLFFIFKKYTRLLLKK